MACQADKSRKAGTGHGQVSMPAKHAMQAMCGGLGMFKQKQRCRAWARAFWARAFCQALLHVCKQPSSLLEVFLNVGVIQLHWLDRKGCWHNTGATYIACQTSQGPKERDRDACNAANVSCI